MRMLNGLKKWVKDYETSESLIEDLEVFYEFYKEGDTTEEELDLHEKKTLNHIEDLELSLIHI